MGPYNPHGPPSPQVDPDMIEGDEAEVELPNEAPTGETLLVKEYLFEEVRPQTRCVSSGKDRSRLPNSTSHTQQHLPPSIRPVTPQSFRPVTPQSFRSHSASENRGSGKHGGNPFNQTPPIRLQDDPLVLITATLVELPTRRITSANPSAKN